MHASRITNILYFAATTQKFAVLHFINTATTAQAGGKEDTSKSFLVYLFGREHKFLKKCNLKISAKII